MTTLPLNPGDKLWNGAIVTRGLADAYNSLTQRIQAFEDAGRSAPEQLLNARHNLVAGAAK